jgi:hypothetical protein
MDTRLATDVIKALCEHVEAESEGKIPASSIKHSADPLIVGIFPGGRSGNNLAMFENKWTK